ncbi:hypothetical protein BH23GEM7_BH23GEM7_18460 [soil metagenome]
MVAQLPMAVALLMGPDHVYTAASESYLRIAGKPVLGRPYREVFPEVEGQGYFELLDQVYATGESWSASAAPAAWDADMDGTPEAHFIDVTFAPVRGITGAVEGVTLTVDVVDDRVHAEQARTRATERTERLQAVTVALAGAVTQPDVVHVLFEQGTAATGAVSGALALLQPDGETLELTPSPGRAEAVDQDWRTFRLDAPVPLAEVTRSGEPQFFERAAELYPRYESQRARFVALGLRAAAVLPLPGVAGPLGAFSLVFAEERRFSPEDRAVLGALARQCAVALERAQLFEAEREALADAEAARRHLERVITQAPVAMYIARGREHVFEVANEPWYAMAGKRPEEVLGRPVREVFPELVPQGIVERIERVYDSGEAFAPEALPLVFDADGDGTPEEHFFNVVYQPLRDAAGVVYAIAAVATEVTELVQARRAAEAARAEAEASAERSRRLQAVAAALNEAVTPQDVAEVCVRGGIAALGADAGSLGVLVEQGTQFEVVYTTGYPPEVAERWRRFPVHPGKPLSDAVLTRVPVLLSSTREWKARYPEAAADHRHAGTAAFAATPLIVGGRVLAGLAFSFRRARRFDEGERLFLATLGEQAAQALERARLFAAERTARATAERLQDLTAALSGSLSTGEVGSATMRHGVTALYADAGVLALLTPTGEELEVAASTGYPPEACMGPGRRWTIDTTIPIAEATRTGKSVCIGSPAEWAERYPGGYVPTNSRSAAWAALPITLEGRTAGALLWTYNAARSFDPEQVALMETLARVCSQALERVHLLETEQRARAEAEKANQSKTEFLSAMSHELRTPLNAIAGYVDLLDAGVRGPINEAQRADLLRIKRAQEILLSLINDVLNFARLEAGRLDIVRTEVPVMELVQELENLIGNQLREKGLSYSCELPAAELLALGDAERIRQILLNLLTNAIKFTDSGGKISISAEALVDQVAIRVSDTGRGVPPDKLESIFDPFVQIERRRVADSQQGVGLGLAISRELARAMGGELTAESRVGEGSTFTLTLARAE